MSGDENVVAEKAKEKTPRKRRTSEEVAAERAAKEAEKATRDSEKSKEETPETDSEETDASAPASVTGASEGGADGMVICNNGKQNEVLILGGVRKTLRPREIWRVPSDLMFAFERYLKTGYFQRVEAAGIITVSGVVTGKMKDPEMTAVETKKPPKDIDPEVSYGDKKTTVAMKVEDA